MGRLPPKSCPLAIRLVLISLFALCSTGLGSAASTFRAQRLLQSAPAARNAVRDLIYLAPTGCNCVRVYDTHFTQVDEIPGLDGPRGIATDADGNLWVANNLANDVLAFHQGSKKPYLTLGAIPNAFAVVVGDDGTVYVAAYSPATVYVYASGTTKPERTIGLKFLQDASGLALDANGDLIVAGNVGVEQGRMLFVGARSHEQRLLPGILASPYGIVVDGSNDRVVSDFDNGATYVFAPGASEPSRVLGVPRAAQPTFSAFNSTRTLLFVGDALHAELDVFEYATGKLLEKVPEYQAYGYGLGVATSPRAPL